MRILSAPAPLSFGVAWRSGVSRGDPGRVDGFAPRAAWLRPGPLAVRRAARPAGAPPWPGGGGAGGRRPADVASRGGERARGHGAGRARVPGGARLATAAAGDLSVHARRAAELALRAPPPGGLAAQGHDGRCPRGRARACCRWASRRPATPRRGTSCGSRGCCGSSRRSAASCGIPTTTRSRSSGAPEQAAPWGWRFEGHHLSLNFTVAPGRAIAVTPAFFGANPAEVPSGPLKGLRVLPGRAGPRPRARRRASIRPARPRDDRGRVPRRHRQRAGTRREPPERPRGCRSGISAPSRARSAVRLLETYARNMRADLAESELRKLHAAGIERVHFAWAGPVDAKRPALLPPPRADAADRVRQHAEQRQPHPLGLARSPRRLRGGPAGRSLPDASRSRLARAGGRTLRRIPGARRAGEDESDRSSAIKRRRCVASAPVSKIRRSSSSRMNVAQSEMLTTKAGPSDAPSPRQGRPPEQHGREPCQTMTPASRTGLSQAGMPTWPCWLAMKARFPETQRQSAGRRWRNRKRSVRFESVTMAK